MTASILRHRPTHETSPSPCRGANCSRPAGTPPTRGATTSDVSPDRTPPGRPSSRDRSSRSAHGADQDPAPHDPEGTRELRCTSSCLQDHGRRASPRARNARRLVRTVQGGSPPDAGDERPIRESTSPSSLRRPVRRAEDVAVASRSDADQRTPHRGSTAGSPNVIVHRQATVSDRHRTTASTLRRSQRVRTRQREGRTGRTVRLDGHRLESDTASSAPAPTTRRRSCSDGYHRSQHPTRRRR